MLLDSPFGEHIRFTLQLSVLIQNLKRTEQVVRGILIKGKAVCPIVD
jgi:hypothetical protein